MRDTIRKVISFDFGRPRSLPPAVRPLPEGEAPEAMGLAIIATADKASHQWAPRWLEHVGLDARMTTSAKEALGLAAPGGAAAADGREGEEPDEEREGTGRAVPPTSCAVRSTGR